MKKKEQAKKITHQLTLDEYDELTMENQILGAQRERGKIIAELERRAGQMMEFAECMESTKDKNAYSRYAFGLQMAVRIVNELRPYEDNVGCPECEAF
jgi:hypothetical protein